MSQINLGFPVGSRDWLRRSKKETRRTSAPRFEVDDSEWSIAQRFEIMAEQRQGGNWRIVIRKRHTVCRTSIVWLPW